MTKSYAPQVIADNSEKFVGNALRFATKEEALAQVRDLSMRWTAVIKTRVVETDDPVNYRYSDGRLIKVEVEPEVEPPLICSICELPIPARGTWTKGNNAQPINDGRCCYDCDEQVVIPKRIAMILASRRGNKR